MITDLEPWDLRAACRDADPNLFFIDAGKSYTVARKLCARCEVRSECLDDALAVEQGNVTEAHGLRAGLTSVERCAEWRNRAAKADQS